jgi:polyhydroxyalkanoate synthase
MAWNSDGTRMPWRMHSEYLTQLYLQNDLAGGRFQVHGRPIDLKSIILPMVVFGTETDHVAPWKSTFKARGLTQSADYTYVLTNGGHNAGIVCGPVHPRRRFRELTWSDSHSSCEPAQWLEKSTLHQGSWWSWWQQWLTAHSGPQTSPPPNFGNPAAGINVLGDAPGEYVLQR